MSAHTRNPQLRGDNCSDCNGTGTVLSQELMAEVDCPNCHGTGLVNSPNACTECHGSGSAVVEYHEVDCGRCNGSGIDPEAE